MENVTAISPDQSTLIQEILGGGNEHGRPRWDNWCIWHDFIVNLQARSATGQLGWVSNRRTSEYLCCVHRRRQTVTVR